MAGEAALTKFKTRLQTWLSGNIGTGVDLYVDRPFDQPLFDDLLPAVNARVPEVSFEMFAYSQGWLHSAMVAFDIVAPSATAQTITAQQAEIAAAIVARLALLDATPGSLGEMLTAQNTGLLATPLSMGQQPDDLGLSDHGESVFAWRFAWLTPIGNFRTVIGQNGEIA